MKKIFCLVIVLFIISLTLDVDACYTGFSFGLTNRTNGHQSQCRSFGSVSGSSPAGYNFASCFTFSVGNSSIVEIRAGASGACFISKAHGNTTVTVTAKAACMCSGSSVTKTFYIKLSEWGLASLSIGDKYPLSPESSECDPGFSDCDYDYVATVPGEVSSVTIKAVANDPNSKITGAGNVSLKIGENKFVIKVTTPQGDSRTYTLTITRLKPKNVTGISLDKNEGQIKVGETLNLNANVVPKEAENRKVLWSSSDPSIATVDSNGTVKGLSAGFAVITAKTEDGGYKASANIEVIQMVTGINLDEEYYLLNIDGVKKITYNVLPIDASNQDVIFESEDPLIADVDPNGNIKGINVGKTKIIVKTVDGGYESSCTVEVRKIISSINVEEKTIFLKANETYKVHYVVYPIDATDRKINWISTNPNIAYADNDGTIHAVSSGETSIVLKSNDGSVTETIKVFVNDQKSDNKLGFVDIIIYISIISVVIAIFFIGYKIGYKFINSKN